MQKYRVLDLFAGIGGFSIGFSRYVENGERPFEIVAAVEIDKNAAATLVSKYISEGLTEEEANSRVICADISKQETKDQIYSICKNVDIIIGGPPCQSFSMIGPRSGSVGKNNEKFQNDIRDNLFEHYLEIVDHYKPLFFVFENVKGILSKKGKESKKFIDLITSRFNEIGYRLKFDETITDENYIVLNAADYGVPQTRERVIIIGNKLGETNPVPKKTHCPPDQVAETGLLPYVTLKDAIGDLPTVIPKITTTPFDKSISRFQVTVERKEYINSLNIERDSGTNISEYHWERFNLHRSTGNESRKKFLDFVKPIEKSAFLNGHIARSQQESDIKLFTKMKEGMTSKDIFTSQEEEIAELKCLIKYNMGSFEDKYRKLSWDKPCHTIIAHLQKDGNRYIHPDSAQGRTLTVREAARIQSFPDDYIINATGNVRFKYIGNAVPPLLSHSIAKALFKKLETIHASKKYDVPRNMRYSSAFIGELENQYI